MKAHAKPGWQFTEGQRAELRRLLLAAYKAELSSPEPIDADDPDILGLLVFWDSLGVPWDICHLRAYRCNTGRGGSPKFIIESVSAVLRGVGRVLEGN